MAVTFYSEIPTFRDFSKVLEDRHYFEVPDSWFILLTDVKGSTKAIEQGRYKQVNMIGAASITCVLNCLDQMEIPFVFGGDGATLIIPPDSVSKVTENLKALQNLSKNEFQIDLRVGLVPINILKDQNLILKVAKYELSPGNNLAQFRGGALTKAEEMVKKKLPGAIIISPENIHLKPNLDGLSCRLSPLRSRRGQILSLICKPQNSHQAEKILNDILEKLKPILGDDFKASSPVSLDRLHWKWLSPTLKDESKLQRGFWGVLFRVLLANLSLKFNIRLGPFVPQKYKSELVINSDFKKFDETLRMVVDCSEGQLLAIENLMKEYFQQKQIFYGLHKSPEALMTCMVFSASQNQHIHFIDGSNGGYAFAALQMKQQIKN